jgi:hypothetical protein
MAAAQNFDPSSRSVDEPSSRSLDNETERSDDGSLEEVAKGDVSPKVTLTANPSVPGLKLDPLMRRPKETSIFRGQAAVCVFHLAGGCTRRDCSYEHAGRDSILLANVSEGDLQLYLTALQKVKSRAHAVKDREVAKILRQQQRPDLVDHVSDARKIGSRNRGGSVSTLRREVQRASSSHGVP